MYTETPQTSVPTSLNYNTTGTILDTEVTVPIELVEINFTVTTAFVTTTDLVIGLDTYATDRSTATEDVATITIPNGATVGKNYFVRIDTPVRLQPGQFFRTLVNTQGVGSAGVGKVTVVYKYAPMSDAAMTNRTELSE